MAEEAFNADCVSLLLADLDAVAVPTHADQLQMAARIAAGEPGAKTAMVRANIRLAVHWAKKTSVPGVEFADLIQEAVIGLHRAVEKYDASKGFTFSTYATWWIRQAIQRAGMRRGPISMSMEANDRLRHFTAARFDLDSPRTVATNAELAERLGLSATELAEVQMLAETVVSLDAGSADGTVTLAEVTADPNASFEEDLVRHVDLEAVGRVLAGLDPTVRAVLTARFGLDGSRARSLRDVARDLHLPQRKVERLLSEALAALAQDATLAALAGADPGVVGTAA